MFIINYECMQTPFINLNNYMVILEHYFMPQVRNINLPNSSIGTTKSIRIFSFGKQDSKNKVYIQAGLHAGEHPGILVAHQLLQKLSELEKAGKINNRIDVVPVANPIGIGQFINGEINGRYSFNDGTNFNRNFNSDVVNEVLSEEKSQEISREDLVLKITNRLKKLKVNTQVEALKILLLGEALAADLVLDLHCDGESLHHIYAEKGATEEARVVAKYLETKQIILSDMTQSSAFDDSLNYINQQISHHSSDKNNLKKPNAYTIELRGRADVSEYLADKDSNNIIKLLEEMNYINNVHQDKCADDINIRESSNMQAINASCAGIVVHCKNLGDQVRVGDVVVKIINPLEVNSPPLEIFKAGINGQVFSRHISKLAYPGMELIKIA